MTGSLAALIAQLVEKEPEKLYIAAFDGDVMVLPPVSACDIPTEEMLDKFVPFSVKWVIKRDAKLTVSQFAIVDRDGRFVLNSGRPVFMPCRPSTETLDVIEGDVVSLSSGILVHN